ncbi:MAG TPA: tetraacyldisaccharide 4'-kinase [Bacteroidales bacterium]|nr:tetraacyldisaccharide 4'-kinase [Bacteroidales bacterium]
MSLFRLFLFPFCLLYGLITWIRNKMFDFGVLPSKHFDIPVVSLGNLSAGGTGKTPHVEYLLGLLKDRYNIAVLSRGYKRKTSGFLVVNPSHKANEVGDEPLQICRKFPDVIIAVDERRKNGINKIRQLFPQVNLIILDDAFQHRYVSPGLSILITGFYNPFFDDYLLPCGSLREFRSGAKRASALIVSKTPTIFPILARKYFIDKVEKYNFKNVFFSTIEYGAWVPINEGLNPQARYKTILMLTGIANISYLEDYLRGCCRELILRNFPDHYQFTETDLHGVAKDFRNMFGDSNAIVMTEKDYMRIKEQSLLQTLIGIPVFYIPIKVVFHKPDTIKFEEFLQEFLSGYQRSHTSKRIANNSILEVQNSG